MMSETKPSKNPADAVAVALTHEAGSGAPPRISASGRGAVAEQIVRIALENGVKIREDADLASILAAIEVDSVIPLEAFAAVAEILTYLYRANGASREEERDALAFEGWRDAADRPQPHSNPSDIAEDQ